VPRLIKKRGNRSEEEEMSAEIIQSTDAKFEEEVLKSEIPVLVDFWAPWCGPCLMIAPVVEEIAQAFQGKLKVVKINVDENPKTPPSYGILGIPTLLLFKGGDVKESIVGFAPKNKLEALVEKHL
jgi:thioredoxin 1